jgi:hypothetical protein
MDVQLVLLFLGRVFGGGITEPLPFFLHLVNLPHRCIIVAVQQMLRILHNLGEIYV